MSRKSRQICTKTWHLVLFVFLPCSRNFLSTIFGIFGKFRIDIVKNKFEKLFFQNEKNLCKKPKNLFSRLKKCRKIFYEKVNENRKFENSDFFRKNRNFQILYFHWLFHRKFSVFFFISKNNFLVFCSDFFSFWKNNVLILFFTISIRNFPKIPKIILRKSREQVKNTKNSKCQVFSQISLWFS